MDEEIHLTEIRCQIDALDQQIQALISQRASYAQEVARIKRAAGTSHDFYRPEREAAILRQVMARECGPLPVEAMARLFREIMGVCLAIQCPLRIAFLGPIGTFTHAAVLKHFGHAVQLAPLGAIDEIFREVEAGAAHFGVVPVENSTEGVISQTQDMFLRSPLNICGEINLRIHHQLIGHLNEFASIRRIYTHQQTLAQCRAWLDRYLPQVERFAVSSNAEGARRAKLEQEAAAIASSTAAEIHGLQILAENIEDDPDNTTRFFVIGQPQNAPSGHDKTSIVASVPNQAGALNRLLMAFSNYQVNLTRIESRPSRQGLWEYVFFIDMEGHVKDKTVSLALIEAANETHILKILGSYPKAIS